MESSEPSRPSWPILLLLVLGAAFVLILLLLPRGKEMRSPVVKALPILGKVPAFSLVDAGGATISMDSLQGKVWIADFIFTTCEGTCPMMTSAMYQLNKDLGPGPGLQFVSISVDPEHDSPEVLRAYAEEYQLPREHWYFLTGDRRAIYTLARDGFHLAVSDSGETKRLITHSSKLALVDGSGSIRGYYEGTDSSAVPDLMRDIAILSTTK